MNISHVPSRSILTSSSSVTFSLSVWKGNGYGMLINPLVRGMRYDCHLISLSQSRRWASWASSVLWIGGSAIPWMGRVEFDIGMVKVDKILEDKGKSIEGEIDSELLEDLVVMIMGEVGFNIFENFDDMGESGDS